MTQRTERTPEPITCQEFVGLVTTWLDEALVPVERRAMEAHLADCDDCTVHVEQVRATIGLLRRLRDDPFDPRLRAALMATLPRRA